MPAMLYIKIQPQSFLGSERIFKGFFLPNMGMAVILFKVVEPFEQIVNTPSTENPM